MSQQGAGVSLAANVGEGCKKKLYLYHESLFFKYTGLNRYTIHKKAVYQILAKTIDLITITIKIMIKHSILIPYHQFFD